MPTPELQLAAEKIKFDALFQYASIGILVVNQKAEIIMANTCLLSQFDYTDIGELLGEKIEFLIPKRFHTPHVRDRNEYIAPQRQDSILAHSGNRDEWRNWNARCRRTDPIDAPRMDFDRHHAERPHR